MTRKIDRSELAIWAEGTRFTTDEMVRAYDDYCTREEEGGREPIDEARFGAIIERYAVCRACDSAMYKSEPDANGDVLWLLAGDYDEAGPLPGGNGHVSLNRMKRYLAKEQCGCANDSTGLD